MTPATPIDPETGRLVFGTVASVVMFCSYMLFGVLTAQGIKVAYHLREGQARYHANYKAGVQKRIDKLLKKFPQLRSGPPSEPA
jgi:hypothetical protein